MAKRTIPGRAERVSTEAGRESWVDGEISGCQFPDKRLGKRLRHVFDQMGLRWLQCATRRPSVW